MPRSHRTRSPTRRTSTSCCVVGAYKGTPDEDAFLYLGIGRTRGLLCISPDLESYVAGELSKYTATLKGRRIAQEAQKDLGGGGGHPKGGPKAKA